MNVHMPPVEARRTKSWFANLPQILEDAFEQFDFESSDAYRSLCDLATVVTVEGHSIDAESSVIDNRKWIAPGTVYVTLVYDPNSNDPVELSDSYPITVYYSVKGNSVEINKVTADVSSFFE
jgi:hypothetical protein